MGKGDGIVSAINETYHWSCVPFNFRNDYLSHESDHKSFEMLTSTNHYV